MKQLLLIICSLFLSFQASAQESIYSLNENLSSGTTIQVSDTYNGTSIDLKLGSFRAQNVTLNGNEAQRIRFDEGVNVMEKGIPDIQYLSVSISIPFTGKTITVINEAQYTDYPSFEIAPSAGDPGIYTDTYNVIYNSDIFNSNSFFPNNLIVAHDPYIYAGTRGQALHIFPVQYNPVTKIVRVYTHISATIESVNEPGINELVDFSPSSSVMNRISGSHFMNNSGESSRYLSLEEQGNMLVITHPSFMETMKPFVDWKNQKGIACEMVDVTTIGGAAEIKKYVSDYYYSKGLTYLLLVGDEKYIPTNYNEKGASDNMYAYISGEDHYPEVLVGRFPCEKVRHCEVMVERTITYEKNPAGGESYNNFLGIGSGSGPGDDDEYDFQHIQNIVTSIKNAPFNGITEMYDGSRGNGDRDGNPSSSMVSSALNNGQGAVMYIGHGTSNNWITSGFSVLDVEKLTNTITQPFIWSAGCDNGQFVGTASLAEFLLRAENGGKPTGAIGTLMSSTGQSWFPPMEAQDEIALILSGRKTNNTSTTVGGISMSGCMRMNDKYDESGFTVTDNWILFGDPSVELRTQIPRIIKPVFSSVIGEDATSIVVSDIDSSMMLAVSVDGKLISAAKPKGEVAVINLPVIKGFKKLVLTITGQNCKTYISEIEVVATPALAIDPIPGNYFNKISTKTRFGWNLKAGVTPRSFILCIRPSGTSNWSTYNVTSLQEISIPELNYLTTYEWKVISNADNASAESAIFTFTTIDLPDEGFEQEGFPRNNWVNSHEWYVDNSESFEGKYALHSGNTSSREFSSLFYECETTACDYISFEMMMHAANQGARLEFYMDTFLIAQWNYTMNWTNMTYPVEPGKHIFEWRFTGGDTSNNQSAAWLDNMYLPINEALVFGNTSQESCAAGSIELQASVSNHASLTWSTNGTGYFDDPNKINAIYYPSEDDLKYDAILLNMNVISNNTCPAEVFNYEVKFALLPQLPVLNDTTLYLNESLSVTGSEMYQNMYILYGNDTVPSSLVIDPTHLMAGTNVITVVGENEMGCSTTKQFTINVISTSRPVAALSVYPNPTVDRVTVNNPESGSLSVISIYSMDGQLIEQHIFEGYGASTLEVSHLLPGMYLVRSESNNKAITGKFIKI